MLTPTLSVDRAVSDLRRGQPVVLRDGPSALLVAAAEYASAELLKEMGALSNDPIRLLFSARRAKELWPDATYNDGWVVASLPADMAILCQIIDPYLHLKESTLALPQPSDIGLADERECVALQLTKIGELLPALLVAAPALSGEDLDRWIVENHLISTDAKAIRDYDLATASSLHAVSEAQVPLHGAGTARVITFRPANGGYEHLAIVLGDPEKLDAPFVRLHSSCITGDILGSLRCDCGDQIRKAIHDISEQGGGAVLYINQEGRGIGIANKIRAYTLQDSGMDTFAANEALGFEADERGFLIAARMLEHLGFKRIKLMTNNPKKIKGLEALGIVVAERVAHIIPPNEANDFYLQTKAKAGHLF